jgi:hypothetical protein
MNITELQNSGAFNRSRKIVIPKDRIIKEVDEIEKYGDDYVLYMTDRTSYGISQCQSLEKTFELEKSL